MDLTTLTYEHKLMVLNKWAEENGFYGTALATAIMLGKETDGKGVEKNDKDFLLDSNRCSSRLLLAPKK